MSTVRPDRVQLTALLDLLFIMIFIGMLTTKIDPPVREPSKTDSSAKTETTLEKSTSPKDKDEIRSIPNGQIRKLFVSNNYYRGASNNYVETNLYAADDNQLWIYRLNLSGAGVVTDMDTDPISADDSNRDGQTCKPLLIEKTELRHECDTVLPNGETIKRHILKCTRANALVFNCAETLFRKGVSVPNNWTYRMDLIRIFDPELKM